MLRHFFKLIWNKRKTNALLIIEIWASFLVLFGLGSFVVSLGKNYLEPLGFKYENVWALNLSQHQDTLEVSQKILRALDYIRSQPEVLEATRSSTNFPFSQNTMNNSVSRNGKSTMVSEMVTDPEYPKVLDIPMVRGRWFEFSDSVGKYKPVILNQKVVDAIFGEEDPIGQTLMDEKFKVMGVIGNFKEKGEFNADKPVMFTMTPPENAGFYSFFLLKTRPGTDAYFEEKLVKSLSAQLPGWGIEIDQLVDSRRTQRNMALVPVIILAIISVFLILNVTLGVFGILNLDIARRRDEIGLRRALGATEGMIQKQFLGETWVLTLFAVVLGLLFAVQFPLLQVFEMNPANYYLAMLLATFSIFALVSICAWIPSRQAATVEPADALREN